VPKKQPLVEDSLISSLVPDPADVPNVRMYVGFLGKSSKPGYWRLYTSPQLNEFIEVRQEDILHAQQMDGDGALLRGTAAWIKAEAELIRTRIGAQQAQTDFLSGPIARTYLAGTQGGGLGTWWTTTTVLTTLVCIVVYTEVRCTYDCDTRGASSGTNSCCMCAP
jgi:hypothetical protein